MILIQETYEFDIIGQCTQEGICILMVYRNILFDNLVKFDRSDRVVLTSPNDMCILRENRSILW